EAVALNNIGHVYTVTVQPKKALAFFMRALPISQAVGDKDGEAIALSNIGFICQMNGQRDMALTYCRRALNLWEKYREGIGADSESKQRFLSSRTFVYQRYIALLLEAKQPSEAFAWTQKVKARSLL